MTLPPMPQPPQPCDQADEPPARRRPGAFRRWALWSVLLVLSIAAVLAVGLYVLPHAADVQRLPSTLHRLMPLFAAAYAVALVLVWTRWMPFMDWLARRQGRKPLPVEISRAARNCLAALFAVMELTVLLHWFGETTR